jgi:uncharacterized protein YfiM (DUF2279 family)
MMKKAVIIVLIFLSGLVSGQDRYFAQDKALHFGYSTALTMLCIETAKDYPQTFRNPELTGVIVAFSVGIAKEVCYDSKVSGKDLIADFAGCVIAVPINRWINRQIEKRYKKKGWN